jgi:hypothetical protein
VRQAERSGIEAADELERLEPEGDIDVGRRRRRVGVLVRWDANTGHVTDVGVTRRLMQVRDVMHGVPRCVLDPEAVESLAARQ